VLSTIAIAISHDGELVATTHGDHTIKVRSWSTGLTSPLALTLHPRTTTTTQVFHYHSARQHRTFRGHPRTPWTVKFHPHDATTIASGCLGFEVRTPLLSHSLLSPPTLSLLYYCGASRYCTRQTPCVRPHASAMLYNTRAGVWTCQRPAGPCSLYLPYPLHQPRPLRSACGASPATAA
jgi:WD40 repeat protein